MKSIKAPVDKEARAELAVRRKRRKKQIIRGGAVFLVLALAFTWYGFQPLTGPIQVGICRTFLQMQVAYPRTMRITSVETLEDRVLRMYYTYTGTFGEGRSSMIECKFFTDPATGGLNLESVQIDRRPVPQKRVDLFNATIPYVIASKPSRIVPREPKDDLQTLKLDDDTD